MAQRRYLSDLSKAWPVESQRAVIREASGCADMPEYWDRLTRRKRQRPKPEDLEERADMLRPTSRRGGETIWVAALGCLAIDREDLARVIAAASARRATLHVPGDELVIPPDPPAALWVDIHAAWERRRRQGLHASGRAKGAEAALSKRRAATAAGVEAVKDDWGNLAVTTAELTRRAGLTYKTLWMKLGPREVAAQVRERDAKLAARSSRRAKPD